VTDGDNDTVDGTLAISVDDDTPTVGDPMDAILAKEEGNTLTGIDLDIDFGADGASTTVTAIQLSALVDDDGFALDKSGNFITSDGHMVIYIDPETAESLGLAPAATGDLIAVRADDTDWEVFRITLDQDAGTYSVTVTDTIDGAAGNLIDFTSGGVSGGNNEFIDFYTGDDEDMDGFGDINIHVFGISEETDTTVNSSVQGMGVDNNSVDDSEQLVLTIKNTNPDPDVDDEDPVRLPVSAVSFTIDSLSNGETLYWAVYDTGGSNDTATWIEVTNGYLEGSGQGASGASDQELFIDTSSLGTFDGIILTAADGSGYRVLNMTVFTEDEGFDTTIPVTVIATDGDGDEAVGTFDVTFDADGNITGTDEAEAIMGSKGDDTIDGGGGDDVIYGGEGNDTIDGGEGDDTIYGDGVDYDDSGTVEADESGDDVIDGGAGNDTVSGGEGDDTISGGDDDDLLFGEEGNDTISGDTGNDTLVGGAGEDDLSGGTGDDELFGGDDNDTLDGGEENDTLVGGGGDDILDGGDGDDILLGGEGDDDITGGAGADTFDTDEEAAGEVTDYDAGEDDNLDEIVPPPEPTV
ncbi:MAG: calcium-binding protein, partial [Desulfobulbaceae bacterium]|nr:calcium-binding protein [Desulfobulbaceae bacterium]